MSDPPDGADVDDVDERARRRALVAVGLDVTWVAVLVVVFPARLVAVAIGVLVLTAGWFATRHRAMGFVLSPVRAFAALIMLVVAVDATALIAVAVAAIVSAGCGVNPVRSDAPDSQPVTPAIAHPVHRPRRHRRPRRYSKRVDDVGSALIHLGFVSLIAVGVAADGRPVGAIGFVVWWITLSWGPIAIHEFGHAIAARHTGNEVPEVHIGVGLTLFRIRNVSVGAVPFLGHAHWIPNHSTMTSRREACIALAGPAANLIAAIALLSIGLAIAQDLVVALGVMNAVIAVINLIPGHGNVNGRPIASDGAQAIRALRSARPAL